LPVDKTVKQRFEYLSQAWKHEWRETRKSRCGFPYRRYDGDEDDPS
jgi:hypothetical protein